MAIAYAALPTGATRHWLEWLSQAARVRRFLRERRERGGGAFDRLKRTFYADLWTTAAHENGATVDDLGYGVLRIARAGRETFVSGSLVMLDGPVTLKMAGNKPLVSRLLAAHGHPTGRFCEYDLGHLSCAQAFLDSLDGPAVVKPAASGAAGAGVTMGVRTPRDLRRASVDASAYCRQLLVEEQVAGPSYRLLYLDGEFLDAIERRAPRIRGDGRRAIDELIHAENARRLRGGEPRAVAPISIDLELTRCLRAKGLTLHDIVHEDRWLTVKHVVNQNTAAENSNVRDRVHPSIVQRGAAIARLLQIRLAGLDLITRDISRPLEDTGGAINEVNTTPALHHHYLIDNPCQQVPVARCLLDRLLDSEAPWV